MESGAGAGLTITTHGTVEKGEYRASLPGTAGTALLSWTGDSTIRHANHTYTPDDLRDQGIAGALVRQLIDDAREQGFQIVPACSYVAAAFKRHPEWADLLAN